MRTVVYRQADPSEIPAMARIRAGEWGTEGYWRNRIAAYLECKLHPRQALMPRAIFVALESGSVVGFIAGHLTLRHGCEGELEWINVIPEHRRSGIASGLLRLLAEWFAGQKVSRVCVDVDPANSAARRFYARYGAGHLNPHWMVWDDIKVVLQVSSE